MSSVTFMDKFLPDFKKCRQKEPPFCRAACPFHLDVADFIEKISRQAFNAAYTLYKNATVFPELACHLCNQPCLKVCPLNKNLAGQFIQEESDVLAETQAIQLCDLERAAILYATKKEPQDYNLPAKDKKIAIIGAGPSGLSCALRLATKKYKVYVFEESHRIGGHLWDIMNSQVFLQEIAFQFQHEKCDFFFGCHISSLEDIASPTYDYRLDSKEALSPQRNLDIYQSSSSSLPPYQPVVGKPVPSLKSFDAIYVATGSGGYDLDVLSKQLEAPCYLDGSTGIFAGGSILGHNSVEALEDGVKMSTTIDNFLRTRNLLYNKEKTSTGIALDPSRLKMSPAVKKTGLSNTFSEDEAEKEASRCLLCQCDACLIYGDLFQYAKKWPLRIRDEVQATTLPGTSEVKATPAKRLISSATLDGLCREVCPEAIDPDGLILEARKSMHRQGKLAWVFNEFWLRDMDFASGHSAGLTCFPPKGENCTTTNGGSCKFAFFPGCQLGASDPELVASSYQTLLKTEPSTGLMLSCCGIPAEWAGDEKKTLERLSALRNSWETLGRPTLIMACPTCTKFFNKHMPDIVTQSLYVMLNSYKSADPYGVEDLGFYSIFDPCSTRDMPDTRTAVRNLATHVGASLEPLPNQEAHSACCSYGGQGSIANPAFNKFVINKRISEGAHPYITYCINCRDTFRSEGKSAVHILELLFEKSRQHLPSVSARRENRLALKEEMLRRFWKEDITLEREGSTINLEISEELREKLNNQRILESDVSYVVEKCHNTGDTVSQADSNTLSGYGKVGHMTLWVEYTYLKDENLFVLINAYTHRMAIELEEVWNGIKR